MTLQLLSKGERSLLKKFTIESLFKYNKYQGTHIVTASSGLTRNDTFSLVQATDVRAHSVLVEIVATVRGL